jgi:hypothetical protein
MGANPDSTSKTARSSRTPSEQTLKSLLKFEYYFESLGEANHKPERILRRGRITIEAEGVRKRSAGNGKRLRSIGIAVVGRDFSSRIYAHWICGEMQYIGYA